MSWLQKLKHKFKAKPKNIGGKKFPSQLEAKYFQKLQLAQQSGNLLFFLRQVPFDLPGNTRYFIDFVEFWKNGDIVFSEVKGFETPLWKIKRKQMEELYPIEINVVKKT